MTRKKRPAHPRTADELIEAGQLHAERGELADAEGRYREALARSPEHLGALTLLGLLLVDREDADGAIELLERARQLAPGFAPIQLALGSAHAAAGNDGLAVTAMEAAIKLDTASTLPMERLAKYHIRARRPREAIGLLRRILRRDPAHAEARFLLGGLTGDREATRGSPPSAWIADLFDSYAAQFEEHLTTELHYRVPEALARLVAASGRIADASARVVDLGCGTGLVGAHLRPHARTLIGSDLSARMITRARERGVYDDLRCEDLGATLERERDVDVVIAADVFIYVGALESTFAACSRALRVGGLLAFSVERTHEDDVVLRSTLRYAHSDVYVRRLASEHGFTVQHAEPSVLRIDDAQPVHGMLYVLRA
jgi:predicted TPR repeat methyltransferase